MTAAGERSLLAQAVRGFGWIVAWRMATRLLGMGSTLVLIRLLAPADFGLIALSSSFLAAIDAASALGVEEAVVRAHRPSRATYDTAFSLIALRGALMALLIAAGAGALADFYGDGRLRTVLYVTAGVTLLGGFENVGVLDFRRDMRFDREFNLQLLPRLAGVVAALVTGALLRDYWALVVGTAVQRLLRLPLTYRMHPHRPRFTLAAWRELAGFSFWTWLLCMARLVRDHTHVFVLGRVLGPGQLGMFAIAGEVALLPASELLLPMGRALFSALSVARRGGEDPEAIYLRMTGLIALLMFPAGVGIALVGAPLVRLMLGAQWMAAAPLLQVIALAGAFTVFEHCGHIQFDAYGLVAIDFRVIGVTAAVRVAVALLLVPPFGLMGAAGGMALALALEQFAYLLAKRWTLPFDPAALWRQVWRPLLATAAMAAVMAASGLATLPPGADGATAGLHVVVPGVLGAGTYGGLLLLLWLLAGRPAGAEADILRTLGARLRRFGIA